jgi:Mg-chelatase subunit ChlD
MPSATVILSAALSFLLISNASAVAILPRATSAPTCQNLVAKTNNGDRKIAIVIDSSGSMAENDPDDLRLAAGRSLVNDWLISSKEATSSTKPDLVTVINFDTSATLDYPLGDPGGANSSFDTIGADGGTYIAGGVQMAIAQLTTNGTGATDSRSGMIVFTDGVVREFFLLCLGRWDAHSHWHYGTCHITLSHLADRFAGF